VIGPASDGMFDSYFSGSQQLHLAIAFLVALGAVVLHGMDKPRQALVLLLVAAFLLRSFFAFLDPYLHRWDEVVHAVVAKNMAIDPFKPMLYREEALGLDHRNWSANHVWLHKQPFFLWCMALSIKVFGAEPWAVRLPSVVLSTALVYFTHGIARKLHGERTAFIAALLMVFAFWPNTLVSGSMVTDHNDMVFISLVAGSLWAWYVLLDIRPRAGVLLIAVFAAAAVLTKWLSGLLVFAGWALVLIVDRGNGGADRVRFAQALGLVLLLVLPWQIYAWWRFPVEMAYEMAYNSRHVHEALEGHRGGTDFHFAMMRSLYHPFGPYLLSISVLFALAAAIPRLRWHALGTTVGTYVFFTLVATKMPGYVGIVMPFILVGIAYWLVQVGKGLPSARAGQWASLSAATVVAFAMLDIERVQVNHTEAAKFDPYQEHLRTSMLANMGSIEALREALRDVPNPIVFGAPHMVALNATYASDFEVLSFQVSSDWAKTLQDLGYTVVSVDPEAIADDALPPGVLGVDLGPMRFKQLP